MSKSPTLHSIEDNFSRIKRKLGLKRDKSNGSNGSNRSNGNIIFTLLYMIVTLVVLISFKPKIVCKEKMPYEDGNESKISYTRFLLFYILLQIPLFIYIMCL